ncbi:RNA recognition motif containing protein [Nitzschia inconspicua]|uniref:RNA recognition motif containing protein n=1 Tax=Nitzschia inconspicua TaxID=303405 RepID=A0A9K3PE10_9STRA|nr:RNA recognition motif containing protein [Nitzschia inconspicua]
MGKQKKKIREEERMNSTSNDDDDVYSQSVKDRDSEDEDDHSLTDEGEKGTDGEESDQEHSITKKKKKKVFRLSLTETENFNEKLNQRGVLYIARIPPKMTPTKIKALLSEFAEVTRVYLVEEDATVRKRRRKELGRSGGKRYLEGWIEFASKKKAKHLAAALNNTPISNHKRNPHYGDLWNLKYLSKFKWSHLTEKVAYERRVREQKLRVEMMQARRENAAYAAMVETGKKLDKIEERKRKRGDLSGLEDNEGKKKKRNKDKLLQPMNDGSDKPAKMALLGGLL